MDMGRGVLMHLPQSGGVMEQDERLISHIWAAWRTWVIMGKRPSDHTSDDVEFIRKWVFDGRQDTDR